MYNQISLSRTKKKPANFLSGLWGSFWFWHFGVCRSCHWCQTLSFRASMGRLRPHLGFGGLLWSYLEDTSNIYQISTSCLIIQRRELRLQQGIGKGVLKFTAQQDSCETKKPVTAAVGLVTIRHRLFFLIHKRGWGRGL